MTVLYIILSLPAFWHREAWLLALQTYAVIGAGAIGGYYGACLQRAGHEVHFLLHSDFEHVRDHGLSVKSKNGDFALPEVNAYCLAAGMPRCEGVFGALKSPANELLPEILPHLAGPSTVVLLLQNGLGAEPFIAAIDGVREVMSGLCFVCSRKTGPGRVRHEDYGMVKFVEYHADNLARPVSDRLLRIASDYTSAGIETQTAEDYLLARWQKLVWNVPFNGLTVTLGATTRRIVEDPSGRALARTLMEEVRAGAAACGKEIAPELVDQMIRNTEVMVPYEPSMKLDYDNGRPMEIESIYGNPLRAAENAGARLPAIRCLYEQLRFLERRRTKDH
jgi:2-dehydropantoate 2-reductase